MALEKYEQQEVVGHEKLSEGTSTEGEKLNYLLFATLTVLRPQLHFKAIWTPLLSYTEPFLKKQGQHIWIFFGITWFETGSNYLTFFISLGLKFIFVFDLVPFLLLVELSLCSFSTSLPLIRLLGKFWRFLWLTVFGYIIFNTTNGSNITLHYRKTKSPIIIFPCKG